MKLKNAVIVLLASAVFVMGCSMQTDGGRNGNAGNGTLSAGENPKSETGTSSVDENGEKVGNSDYIIKEENDEKGAGMPMDIRNKSYSEQAEWAQEMLKKYYWNESERFMNNTYPSDKDNGHLNYWWKAHAVDAMMDGYERTGEKRYTDMAEQIVKGIIWRNGSLYNEFYDDMEWLALSALRLYDATGDETIKNYVLKLWEEIKKAWWEDELGGMAWKKNDDNRNTCSNGPAAILAARLYTRFGDEENMEWARKIHAWLKKNLVDPESGIVWDGLAVKQDGTVEVNKSWLFTYGQGTYLGAGVELYKATGEEQYLRDAEKTAAAALDKLVNFSSGILKDEGQGDGGLFKGILIRYLVNLYEVNRDEAIKEMIYHNTDSLVNISYSDGLFGTSWDKRRPMPLDLSTQLSGVFLVEGAAKIDRMENK